MDKYVKRRNSRNLSTSPAADLSIRYMGHQKYLALTMMIWYMRNDGKSFTPN